MTLPPKREIGQELSSALNQSTGSYELVFAAIAAAGVGYLIDRGLGTSPVFLVAFALAGFIGAAYSIKLNYEAKMKAATESRLGRVGDLGHTDLSSETEAAS